MAAHQESNNMVAPALLVLATILGFGLANSGLNSWYNSILDAVISFQVGNTILFNKSTLLFINDGLMAVFFLFIGLELKREIVVGELSDFKKAALPIFAALGGMVIPALFYIALNSSEPTRSGWGIPMATDIAFALGVLTFLGRRVPSSLKVLLAAIAIVDDLGAILVIALFYTSEISISYLGLSLLFYLFAIILNQLGVMKLSLYALIGIPLWYFMLKSGVHATIAGVLLAMTIPLSPRDRKVSSHLKKVTDGKNSVLDSPAIHFEKSLIPWVSLLIVPIFAFANSGVSLGNATFGSISLGVIVGLVAGKPLGIGLGSYFAVKLGLGKLSKGVSWKHIWGVGCLAGIGFTMSLFVGSLAFTDPAFINQAKLAILIGSGISASLGVFALLSVGKPGEN